MTTFITIAGKKQVGKDTVATMIKDSLTTNPDMLKYRIVDGDICIAACDGWGYSKPSESVHIAHFADPLKDACSIIFGIDRELMETEEGKQSLTHITWPYLNDQPGFVDNWMPDPNGRPMTVREVLQFVGTELFRNQMCADVWIQSVFQPQKYGANDIVIVADCRFPNEADAGRDNGILIRVERRNNLKDDSHDSETVLNDYPLGNYDYFIDNNGTVDELLYQVQDILRLEKLI